MRRAFGPESNPGILPVSMEVGSLICAGTGFIVPACFRLCGERGRSFRSLRVLRSSLCAGTASTVPACS